jgi:RNA polymerase sigma factor (sigma-70 family)
MPNGAERRPAPGRHIPVLAKQRKIWKINRCVKIRENKRPGRRIVNSGGDDVVADGGSRALTAADPKRTDAAGHLDPNTVAALYDLHSHELRLFLLGVLRNADLAAEALQNAYLRAVEAGHTAREETQKGWLFQVAFNEAMLLRRRSRVHDRSLREMARTDLKQAVDGLSDRPEDRLVRLEAVENVCRALQELPFEQRQVVEMRIYEEKTFAVIATELSAPLGTILTRMRLALQRLSRTLGSEHGPK